MRAGQAGHVLDDPGDRWWVCTAIAPGPLGHLRGGELRGGHDDQLGAGHQLGHRDRHVAGARRQVHEQHVQVAPVHVGEELLQRAVQHRARATPRACCPVVNIPIEMTFTPCADGGMIIFSTWVGSPVTPSMRGTECP